MTPPSGPTAGRRPPTFAERAQLAAFRVAVRALAGLPFRTASRIGGWLGALGWFPLGIRRTVVERQVRACFPDLTPAARRSIARGAYVSLGRTTVETALLAELDGAGVAGLFRDGSGADVVREALAEGRGAVLVSAHLGNWELGGAYLAARGIPLDAVFFPPANPAFDAYLVAARARIGMRVVTVAESARVVPRALREGRAVAILADQALWNVSAAPTVFFGRPAFTPRGPAVFALRTGTPMVFCASVRRADGWFDFLAERVPLGTGDGRGADVDALAQVYTSLIERWVRRLPDQYFWHHKRWKRQPEGTPAHLRDPVVADG